MNMLHMFGRITSSFVGYKAGQTDGQQHAPFRTYNSYFSLLSQYAQHTLRNNRKVHSLFENSALPVIVVDHTHIRTFSCSSRCLVLFFSPNIWVRCVRSPSDTYLSFPSPPKKKQLFLSRF